MFCVFLDGDQSLWERTVSSSPNAVQRQWQDVTVEHAVTHSFAAASHMMNLISSSNNNNNSTGSKKSSSPSSLSGNTRTFTSFVVDGESKVKLAQTGFSSLKDIGVPSVLSRKFAATSSNMTTAAQTMMPHMTTAPPDDDDEQNIGGGGSSNNSAAAAAMTFFGPVKLSSLIAKFVDYVEAFQVNTSSSSSTQQLDTAAPRFVALLGRSAGVTLGEEADLDAAISTLIKLLRQSAIVDSSIDIVLLPRALTIAELQQQQQQQQQASAAASSYSSATAVDDDDVAACTALAEKVKRAGLTFRVTVVRARDCSEIGGCMARAMLDHGK